MLYHFGHLAVVGWTIFHDVIDVANLTYHHSSLIQHKPQLSQILILIFIDKLLEKILWLYYDVRLKSSPDDYHLNSYFYQSCLLPKCVNSLPLLSNYSFIIVCWKAMEMDVGIFMLLWITKNYAVGIASGVVSKSPWMTAFPTCSKHRDIFHRFCNVEDVIYWRKEDIVIRTT